MKISLSPNFVSLDFFVATKKTANCRWNQLIMKYTFISSFLNYGVTWITEVLIMSGTISIQIFAESAKSKYGVSIAKNLAHLLGVSEFLKTIFYNWYCLLIFPFFNQHFTFMIHEALKAPHLVALPWQNTQNLDFFINLILWASYGPMV